MTKGQLSYTWVPIERYLYKSDLWRDLVADFGSAGPTVWLVLQGEWREPEAEIIERNGERGLYRRVRFSYLWGFMPPGVGSKTLAKIMVWLDDRKHWELEAEDRRFLLRLGSGECFSMHRWSRKVRMKPADGEHTSDIPVTDGEHTANRASTYCQHMIGSFWPKLLKFREGCFGYIDREKREIKRAGSTEPNQTESKPNFKYVLNSETGEYDHVPAAGSKEKGD